MARQYAKRTGTPASEVMAVRIDTYLREKIERQAELSGVTVSSFLRSKLTQLANESGADSFGEGATFQTVTS